jgi:ribosomal protein S18 acetylase RimI-like enzyme
MDREPSSDVVLRPAADGDLVALGALAGALVRMHATTDPRRFLLVDGVEEGYARWFAREIRRPEAIVIAAARGDVIVGYGYATIEGRDWNMLLDDHGAIHDVFVDPTARNGGVAARIVRSLCEALEEKGTSRIVLSTMVQNEAAQRVFMRCGFRPTMLEMTRG